MSEEIKKELNTEDQEKLNEAEKQAVEMFVKNPDKLNYEDLKKEYGILAYKYTEVLAMFLQFMSGYMALGNTIDEFRGRLKDLIEGKLEEFEKEGEEDGRDDEAAED